MVPITHSDSTRVSPYASSHIVQLNVTPALLSTRTDSCLGSHHVYQITWTDLSFGGNSSPPTPTLVVPAKLWRRVQSSIRMFGKAATHKPTLPFGLSFSMWLVKTDKTSSRSRIKKNSTFSRRLTRPFPSSNYLRWRRLPNKRLICSIVSVRDASRLHARGWYCGHSKVGRRSKRSSNRTTTSM